MPPTLADGRMQPCNKDCASYFSRTRTALSWCLARKAQGRGWNPAYPSLALTTSIPVRCLLVANGQWVLAFSEDRLADDLSVVQLAQVAGLDSSGFTRALRARTGLAPYAWLTERRMKRAFALLLTDLTVTHVAAMLGYSNPGKSASAFRRVTGYTPSQWKETRGTGNFARSSLL
ncbi:MAG: AraC family transcriptional regulator [Sphingobium sp.]|nr:AraC family transcriptional regulator [Sphingobium sp.]